MWERSKQKCSQATFDKNELANKIERLHKGLKIILHHSETTVLEHKFLS